MTAVAVEGMVLVSVGGQFIGTRARGAFQLEQESGGAVCEVACNSKKDSCRRELRNKVNCTQEIPVDPGF